MQSDTCWHGRGDPSSWHSAAVLTGIPHTFPNLGNGRLLHTRPGSQHTGPLSTVSHASWPTLQHKLAGLSAQYFSTSKLLGGGGGVSQQLVPHVLTHASCCIGPVTLQLVHLTNERSERATALTSAKELKMARVLSMKVNRAWRYIVEAVGINSDCGLTDRKWQYGAEESVQRIEDGDDSRSVEL